jgi:hypothetical protein
MSSPAAQAMYPNLAAKERERDLREKQPGTLPGWAKSDHPLWSERPDVMTPWSLEYLAKMGIRLRK